MRATSPVLPLLLFFLCAGDTAAQATSHPALEGLRPRSRVRVETRAAERLEGRIAYLSDTTLVLQHADGARTLTGSEIREVVVRHSASGTGAAVGAIIGGAGLLGLSLVACSMEDTSDVGCPFWAVGLVTVGGAGAGGLVGAMLGGLFPRWRTHYTSREPAVAHRPD